MTKRDHLEPTDPSTAQELFLDLAETTGLTQAELGQVLRDEASTVYDHGQGDYTVIGRTDYLEEIVISIVGGTIVSVSQTIEDPQGREIIIDRSDRHPVQDDHEHPNSYDEIEEAIKNPDEIWENGRSRFYVKKINGHWLVVRTRFNGYVWTIGTAVYEGANIQEVRDVLRRKSFDIPADRVYSND